MRKLIFLVSFLIASTSAANCLDRDLVVKVTKPFKIVRRSGGALSNPKDLCDSNNAFYKIAEALIFIAKIQDAAGGPIAKSTSVVAQEGPFNFFKKRIKTIVIEDGASRTKGCVIGYQAYVNPGEGHITHICPDTFIKFEAPTTSAFLIHEARHIEGYSHTHCEHGSYLGEDANTSGACDKDYPTQGSYGIGTGYKIQVMNLAKDPATKQGVRSEVISDLLERFNTLPWDLNPGILALSSDGIAQGSGQHSTLSFFDGDKILAMKNLPLGQVLTSRSGFPTFFSQDGQVKSYVYAPQLVDTTGSYAEEYRTKSTPAERNDLLDVYYSPGYSCKLYSHTLECVMTDESGKDHFMNVSVGAIRPYAILEIRAENFRFPERYLVDEDGGHYQLPETTYAMDSFTERDLVKESYGRIEGALGFARVFPGKVYMINNSHQLMSINGSKRALVPQFQGRKVQRIIPFIWSKKLETM